MKYPLIILAFLLYGVHHSSAQERVTFTTLPDTTLPSRVWMLSGTTAVLYTSGLMALNKAWYKDYPKTSFHFFNDMGEWNQMDKAGHVFSAYFIGKYNREMWRWSGLPRRQQIWIGGLSGLAYQSVIEILDGYSGKWGFSWGDMGANAIGAALLIGQELAWDEQRIQLKFSFHPVQYEEPALKRKTNELFGTTYLERMLKDYNGQTYWLSVNLHSFNKNSWLPKWLNIAAGMGAADMYGGRDNTWTDQKGVHHDYSGNPRIRQFYLSPDVDFTKIPTRRKGVRVLFQVLNMLKFPAPALEINSRGQVKVHAVYF
ncbi:YfiM family protein [Chitinophaga nivalis]|uniref:YfiM family protein n=1 Tax=Chitinophaga nivalis TaxID=2991709 RepID=A0ABT3IQL1_9BACT|nr:YfiM family protein [Chitinophaga nivalis]MCW3464077.1 YfiM family protein [Chitinophaga nivalis]MCW3486233.1 YfiM family protein [Chitinophaga nivalis]